MIELSNCFPQNHEAITLTIACASLLESLYILDCYRVIIMQCPPSLSWHHSDSFARAVNPSSRIHDLHRRVAEIVDGGRTITPNSGSEFSLASLACASVFLWPVIYPRQNRYGVSNLVVESFSLWKRDFADLACDTWLRLHGQDADVSHLTIYHMLNIMLRANLTVVQSFAHSAPGSPARDPEKGLAAREVQLWTRSPQYKFARWHADHMIAAIEGAFTTPVDRSERPGLERFSTPASSSATEAQQLPFESPHTPYAIYFATLIIWCGVMTDQDDFSTSLATQAAITRGERLLSLHRIHIAQLLARVLNDVR